MEKYKCIKSFSTLTTGTVEKDSIWEYDDAYVSHSEVRLYAENGDDDGGYIDITHEHFQKYFQRIG